MDLPELRRCQSRIAPKVPQLRLAQAADVITFSVGGVLLLFIALIAFSACGPDQPPPQPPDCTQTLYRTAGGYVCAQHPPAEAYEILSRQQPEHLVPQEYSAGKGLTNELCLKGHPRKRSPACTSSPVPGCIAYGGLRERKGFERDHFIPEALCREEPWCDVAAGNPDYPPESAEDGNVWYQPCTRFEHARCAEGPAAVKDLEEYQVIGAYCGGSLTMDQAEAQLRLHWTAPR